MSLVRDRGRDRRTSSSSRTAQSTVDVMADSSMTGSRARPHSDTHANRGPAPGVRAPRIAWPSSQPFVDLDLDRDGDALDDLDGFASDELSSKTLVKFIVGFDEDQDRCGLESRLLDEEAAIAVLNSQNNLKNRLEFFGISRLDEDAQSGNGTGTDVLSRLLVNPTVFRSIMTEYHMPAAFVGALSRTWEVSGGAFRHPSPDVWTYWCLLPMRYCGPCDSEAVEHLQWSRRNHMNPYFAIHLGEVQYDIGNFHTGVFLRGDRASGKTTVVVVNLAHSRLKRRIMQPTSQIQRAIQGRTYDDVRRSPCFVLVIYLAEALKLWKNTLVCFNDELLKLGVKLQEELAEETSVFMEASKELNSSLHSMAAHLHRYKTELECIGFVLSDLVKHRAEMLFKDSVQGQRVGDDAPSRVSSSAAPRPSTSPSSSPHHRDLELERIEQLQSQLKAISSFSDEMERKVQNILALLFNQIQAINDKTLQAILKAAQVDAQLSQKVAIQSHLLTISMRRDSIAMKTIAVLTLFFLPATSFAAIFAMPFFTETEYLQAPSQVWIWVILTVISTLAGFAGYHYVVQRAENEKNEAMDSEKMKGLEKGSDDGRY